MKPLPLIAALLITVPAFAQVPQPELTFPLTNGQEARFEFLAREKGKNYYSERGHGTLGDMITFDVVYTKDDHHFIKFYAADCEAYGYQEIASSHGRHRDEINANMLIGNGSYQKSVGPEPAAIKAKMVCNDWVLLWK